MRTTITLDGALISFLKHCHLPDWMSIPAKVTDILRAYFELYSTTLNRMNGLLTVQEAMALLSVLNATLISASQAVMLPYAVEDAAKYEYLGENIWPENPKESVQALVQKLKGLSPFQLWVIVSLIEKVKNRSVSSNEDDALEDILRKELYPLVN